MKRRGGSVRGGFTLIEVLIGNGILLIGLVGVAAGLNALTNLRRSYTEVQAATAAARAQLEVIRAADFDDLLTTYGGGVPFGVDMNGDGANDLTPSGTATDAGSVLVETVPGLPTAAAGRLLRAIATVQWRGVTGDRTVRLVTLLSDRD
ncbi:MAG: type IV pilus modification PilV family protein [Planctomycetota bacterium]